MLPINEQLGELLSGLCQAPTVYIWAQVPLITNATTNAINYNYLGSQYIIKNPYSFTRTDVLDVGANSMDIVLDNTLGLYSPINNVQPFAKYFQVGLADLTYQVFMGITNNGAETIVPKGVFLSTSVAQQVQNSTNALTLSALDQFSLFVGDIYTTFPPRLYGQQQSSYYNPNYAMQNPNLDKKTFVGDTAYWMQDDTDSDLFNSDFVQVSLYLSNIGAGMTPVQTGDANYPYSIDFTHGVLNFSPNPVVNSSLTGAVAAGVHAVTPVSGGHQPNGSSAIQTGMTGISVGSVLIIDTGTTLQEYVTVSAKTSTTFTALFENAHAAGALIDVIVSVDARPLSMPPELALYHLFVDFGAWNPAFLKFDQTGIQMPLVALAQDRPMLDCANDIVAMTAPRGSRWRLWIDEVGYIRFTEGGQDHAPVKYLIDSRDLIEVQVQQDASQMYNVVRANAISVNNQPLTSISYDVTSINLYGQKPTFDVPEQYLNITKGMDPGAGMSYLCSLTNSILFEYCRPIVTAEIQVFPDISIQVGDLINITEASSGMKDNWLVKQVADTVSGQNDTHQQNYYIEKMQYSQDFNFGIGANIGVASPTNANVIQAEIGFLQDVSLSDSTTTTPVYIVQNGVPSYDSSLNPVIYTWDGSPLNIDITIQPPGTSEYLGNLWIWRWLYIASDAYFFQNASDPYGVMTGAGTIAGEQNFNNATFDWATDIRGAAGGLYSASTYPYDVRNDTEPGAGLLTNGQPVLPTPLARRFWRPLLRCPDWYTNDGVTPYAQDSTGTKQYTFNSTWTGGVGPLIQNDPQDSTQNQPASFYGNLRVAVNDYFANTTSNFKGASIYAAGTAGASYLGTSSTVKFGVDFGLTQFTGGNIINYVVDSEFRHTGTTWTLTHLAVSSGSQYQRLGSITSFYGNASAIGPQMNVGGTGNIHSGDVITISVNMDASNANTDTMKITLKDSTGANVASLTATNGTQNHYSVTITVGGGISWLQLHCSITGGSATGPVYWSQFFVQEGATYSPYVESYYLSPWIYYGITNKVTPCFLQILTASDFGTMQLKTIAFQLKL